MSNVIKDRLLQKMEMANINARDLERKAGLSLTAVSNILNGRSKNPTIETIAAIAQTLDCSIDELVHEITPGISRSQPLEKEKSHEWNFFLLKETISYIEEYLKAKNYPLSFEEGMLLTKEIYTYSLGKPSKALDKQFAEWLINKNVHMP